MKHDRKARLIVDRMLKIWACNVLTLRENSGI